MSKRKKKLYARKYQPWYLKKGKLAAAMEAALLPPPRRVSPPVRDMSLRGGDASGVSTGNFNIRTGDATGLSKLRIELDSIRKDVEKIECLDEEPRRARRDHRRR